MATPIWADDPDMVSGPDPELDRWRVEFLLQSRQEPSLMVPAERIWRTRGRAAVLAGMVEDPRQHLLTDLGHASRLYPELEQALDGAKPEALVTDTAGAYHFLAQAAPLLEAAGFGVLVPPWWRSQRARLGLRVHARTAKAGGSDATGQLGLETLADYHHEVALGETTLSEAELRRLAELKAPLVRIRGKWVEVRPDEIGAALRLVEGGRGGPAMTVRDVLRMGLGTERDAVGLPVEGVEADGLARDARLRGGDRPAARTHGDPGRLPRQSFARTRSAAWAGSRSWRTRPGCLPRRRHGARQDDPGARAAPRRAPAAEAGARLAATRPTLVVCPMSVVGNWQREAERFAPGFAFMSTMAPAGSTRGLARRRGAGVDLVITTYALSPATRHSVRRPAGDRVVLDEAQNIKNPTTRQTQAVRRAAAAHRVALTGTPVENHLSELWSIMEVLNPGLLGSAKAFRVHFACPIERYRDDEAAARLRRLTGPFILRRLKTDRSIISDLPDKLEMKVYCNLTREQATLYQAVVDEMLERIEASRGHRAPRRSSWPPCAAEAGLQPPGPAPRRRLAPAPAARASWRASTEMLEEVLAEGDRALCLHPVRRDGRCCCAPPPGALGRRSSFLHGGATQAAPATGWSRASRRRAARRSSCCPSRPAARAST